MYIEKDENNKFLEKWKKVERSFTRVKHAYERKETNDYETSLDNIEDFFNDCFSLKDWLSRSQPNLKDAVEDLFKKRIGPECFQVCADFANRSKHLILERKVRKDAATRVVSQNVTVFVGVIGDNTPPVSKYSWDIESEGKRYDAYTLAKNCFDEWKKFLMLHRLLQDDSMN